MADQHHEIVIIRRGGHGDHDEHHGGVWKIAFADFMTAMMAFFLVMWLIAANDKTRATIARYFNPVKLVDATVRPPGIHDPKPNDATITTAKDKRDAETGAEAGHKQPEGPPPAETPQGREARLDETLRTNPYVALAEIAGKQGASDMPPKDAPRATARVIGRKGGTAFRDPFAPPSPPVSSDKEEALLEIVPPRPAAPQPNEAAVEAKLDAPQQTPPPPAAAGGGATDQKPVDAKPGAGAAASDKKGLAPKAKEQAFVKEVLSALNIPEKKEAGPEVKVQKTSDGYLISLTDTNAFSMFSSGSAVPGKRVVQMMEKIAQVLANKPGKIVIRGFTDNKPFHSKRYDNWNLSIDRAQTAHYMLVRGGLPEDRIAGIQGFADRLPPNGVDPSSPLNRRIEILLKDDGK